MNPASQQSRGPSRPRRFLNAMALGACAALVFAVSVHAAEPAAAPGAKDKPSPFVGKPFQDFSVTPVDGGKAVSLSSFKGSPLIVDIWATWCPPCRASMPVLNHAAQLGKPKGLKILSISDEPSSTVKAFLKQNPYNDLVFFLDEKDQIAKFYDINAIPTTFAIDSKGIIQGVEVGFGGPEGLQDLIAKLGVKIDLSEKSEKAAKAAPHAGESGAKAAAATPEP